MLDRTIAPPFQKTTRFDLLEPHTSRLSNGLNVHYLIGGQQDVVKIELIFNGGRWYEQKWGAAHFMANLLMKGSKRRNSFEIAKVFDFYGAHVEINPGLDVVSVALYSLTKNLRPVLELLYEIITETDFPERELEQSKAIYLQNLRVNKEKTSFQAGKYFRKHLFGEIHPYGKELDEKEVENLDRDALIDHYEAFFRDLFIIVSGKLDDSSINLINTVFNGLGCKKSEGITLHPPIDEPARRLYEKEGSLQASVRVGKRFIGRNHSDYFDVLLLNHLLGGYFGSRLMKNIREEKGLTYGIYASIHTLMRDSYLVIGADVNKENLGLTFDEIRFELRRLSAEPVPHDELQTARNHFIGSLQAEITTPFSHADKLKNILLYNLSSDYYTRLIQRIDTISVEDLMKAAATYYSEESFYEIAVG
jgi:predicted Zn-dependent peptidase